jgi:hypothetical protein
MLSVQKQADANSITSEGERLPPGKCSQWPGSSRYAKPWCTSNADKDVQPMRGIAGALAREFARAAAVHGYYSCCNCWSSLYG